MTRVSILRQVYNNQMQPVNNKIQPINNNSIQPVNSNQIQPINYNQIQPVNNNQIQPVNNNQIQPFNNNQKEPIIEKPRKIEKEYWKEKYRFCLKCTIIGMILGCIPLIIVLILYSINLSK